MNRYLAFDVGATKTAWATFQPDGTLLEHGRYPTPPEAVPFLDSLSERILTLEPLAVGIGIAGTVQKDRSGTKVCTNIPGLSELNIAKALKDACGITAVVDNDARCALVGEVWKGAAREISSAVLLTLGTGVGGAVMQKRHVLPHPQDVEREISRIMVDPSDVFPAKSGAGTVEALIGGRNLEHRLGIKLADIAKEARNGDAEATEDWELISEYFMESVRAIHSEYSSRNIIVGGVGAKDLELYMQGTPPCPVVAAELGEQAALYGAAALAIDAYTDEHSEWE